MHVYMYTCMHVCMYTCMHMYAGIYFKSFPMPGVPDSLILYKLFATIHCPVKKTYKYPVKRVVMPCMTVGAGSRCWA